MTCSRRRAACAAVLLAVAGLAPAQTILIVTRESLDGQVAARPPRSQEGFMSAMFDFGYVSFDTGPYEPQVDWEGRCYDEPLSIAAEGLADCVVVARIDSRLLLPAGAPVADPPMPEFVSEVSFLLLEVPGGRSLGGGELSLRSPALVKPKSADPTSAGLGSAGGAAAEPRSYEQALLRVGEALAAECLPLLAAQRSRP